MAASEVLVREPLRVLILEDREEDAEIMIAELSRAGYDAGWERVSDEEEFLSRLESPWDLVLADYSLPGGGREFDARRAIRIVRERGIDVPLIIVSGQISEEIAVECMKEGAADYLLKDRLARLGPAVRQALEKHSLQKALHQAEEHMRQGQTIHMWEAMFQTLGGGASALLYRAGQQAGEAAFDYVRATWRPESQKTTVAALGEHLRVGGLGRLLEVNVDAPSAQASVTVEGSLEARSRSEGRGRPTCHFLRGLLAGFLRKALGAEELVADERACAAHGAPQCQFVVHRMFG